MDSSRITVEGSPAREANLKRPGLKAGPLLFERKIPSQSITFIKIKTELPT
jgi:hypothetical protein